jgi:hypothetical protein
VIIVCLNGRFIFAKIALVVHTRLEHPVVCCAGGSGNAAPSHSFVEHHMNRLRVALGISVATAALVGISLAAGTSLNAARLAGAAATSSLVARERTEKFRVNQFDPKVTSSTLNRVGLGPKELAAAGLTGEETELLIGRMMVHLAAHNANNDIQNATRALNQGLARATRAPLPRRVRATPETPANPAPGQGEGPGAPDVGPGSGPGASPAPTPTPPVAEPPPDVVALRLNLTSRLDLAFNASLQGLPPFKSQRLVNMRANAKWELPLPFLVVAPDSRSDEEWLAVKGAIAHVGSAAQRGWAPESDVLARFNAAADAPEVAEARNNLSSRLTEIKTAWDAILDPE